MDGQVAILKRWLEPGRDDPAGTRAHEVATVLFHAHAERLAKLIAPLLTNVFNEAHESGSLPQSMLEGIVSLKRDYVLHIRILLGHVADKRKA